MKNNYHHGNLRQALIDAGIKMINEIGEDALSLRKVAAACGVSHAAPYAHFADKESLLNAIKDMVTERFTMELEQAIHDPSVTNAEQAIMAMGNSYILFFRNNPDYFHFLFQKQDIQIHTDMSQEFEEDYAPFLMLRRLFKKYLTENGIDMPEKEQELELLKTWAIVQGLSSIACMSNVQITLPWEEIAIRGIGGEWEKLEKSR